jgi:hypothetical protein
MGIRRILKPVDMLFHIGGGIREFVNDTDGPAFLERELVGLGVDGYQ